jgi:Kef-type K+ transport system membrane component KefB
MNAIFENLKDPLAKLLLQFIVIILATRTAGSLFKRFGQPSVIGEIAAGIILGPSLLSWLWPDASSFLFQKSSLGNLQLFSQIGVCVFMFVVGLELDLTHVREKARAALIVSNAGIVVPFLLGVGSAFLLYPAFGATGTSFTAFALFMGIAMSITAFPVLVRILKDRGMAKTPLGVMAITCAAVGDATAWAILAFVVAIARATGFASTFLNLGLVALFVAVMLFIVRPQLSRWLGANGTLTNGMIAAALIFMTASALATQVIGIHALFGAFLAGVVMPQKKEFREFLTVRLENFSSVFLLPLFFAFSGLRTQIGLLNDATSWLVCAGVIAVAVAGKLGGTTLAARFTGMSWNDSFSLGALMTRAVSWSSSR